MDGYLKQSTAAQVRWIGPFVDDTDFKTAETGLTIANTDIKVSANGGASANKNSGGGTHDVNGMYAVTWDATDTATVGQLKYSVKVAGALQVFGSYVVLEEAVYDILFAASATGAVPVASIANGAITAAAIATGAIDADAIADNAIDAGALAADCITAAKIANGAIDAATFAADVDAEILSYIVDDATRVDASALNTATGTTIPAIVADTNELQTDWANGGRLDLLIDSIISKVDAVDDFLDTEIAAILEDTGTTLDDFIDTEVAAIKAKTDSLTFTVANQLDANVQSINDAALTGDGNATPWGPA